ncbi:hypothetical protein TTHERM_01533580 (macronuclear) [Tetrahymena thermophila SB210]|uniref:Uncharacterized protein n=1 Tax=Tetrahymena thermophila (strain SB210) TaxID=312017 RepID=Q228N0_TETTS|nr:hypothetical protein TTHERM_01533580 [Tetrahymena thermophila SB210]EAR81743.2 hypothetical protein TTHERM_01533580 [Tetrahymena thermophila SB210]|eukprot:XP_001029406.2 hypothetical protein TTHERM_01533580 [Tetrahymena thermophila SB210]
MIVIQICASLLVQDIQDENEDTIRKLDGQLLLLVDFQQNTYQNIVNNNNMDKNFDNNEEIQSISIIYQTPNVKTRPATNQFLKINKLVINRRKRNSVFSQSIYKNSTNRK